MRKPNKWRMHHRANGKPKTPMRVREARDKAREITARGNGRFDAYKCWCGHWHVGHKPEDTDGEN